MTIVNPDDASAPSFRRVMVLALWFGLLTGLSEAAVLSIKKFYLSRFIRVGDDVFWMSPLVNVGLFLVVGVVVALLFAWPLFRRHLPLVAIGAFTFVAAFDGLLFIRWLENYAKLIVAAGIAVQATRLLRTRLAGLTRIVRHTLPLMAGVVVAIAAWQQGYRSFTYQRGVARLPAADSRAPNVILIVLDTVRARNLSLYGYSRPTTPNLDEWAKNSIVFDNAIATAPWTFPSHASLFTGRWPLELSASWQTALDSRYPTLAEVLRDRGYLTAGFAANIFFCTSEFGLARGFLHYEDYPVSPSQFLVSAGIGKELLSFSLNTDLAFHVREAIGYQQIPGRRDAAQINDAFLRWLDRQDSARPFFAFLNYLDAHQPFLPPEPFGSRFRGNAPRGNPTHYWDRKWSPVEIQAEVDAYDGTIAYMDHQLGRLGEELEQRGVLNDTVVIVTSDHGEHLGEHGFMRHGQTLYRDVLHVPLLIRFPGRMSDAVRVRETVSLRDVPPTVVAMLDARCEECFPGEALTRYWMSAVTPPAGSASPGFSEVRKGIRVPDRYPNAKGDLSSLITDDFHYILNADGTEELYDLIHDPPELSNLARSASGDAVRRRMRREMEATAAAPVPVPR
jgi:arylsulfatase A-like enzyme